MNKVIGYLKSFFTLNGKMNPFKMVFHPIDSIEEMKEKRNGSLRAATLLLIVYTFCEIILTVGKGFIYNNNQIADFNIFYVFSRSLFIVLLFVVANWALCTLLDGEGKPSEIYIYTCYCLIPLIAMQIVQVILSNILVADEYVFVQMLGVAMNLWFFALLIFSMKRLHNYTMSKIIINMFLTLVAMAVIFFLIFLFVTLMQQLYIFFLTIFTEINIRIQA